MRKVGILKVRLDNLRRLKRENIRLRNAVAAYKTKELIP